MVNGMMCTPDMMKNMSPGIMKMMKSMSPDQMNMMKNMSPDQIKMMQNCMESNMGMMGEQNMKKPLVKSRPTQTDEGAHVQHHPAK